MESDIETIVGDFGPVASGKGIGKLRQGNKGDLIVSEFAGQAYEAALRKSLFSGGVVGQVTTVGLATTYTGLVLWNPNGSGSLLALRRVGIAFVVAFAAGSAVGLMTGWSNTDFVAGTAVTPASRYIGAPAGIGKLYSANTLVGTPRVDTIFGAGLTGAITTTPFGLGLVWDAAEGIVLPPGGWVAIYTSTASGAAGGNFSMEWREAPLVV